MADETLTPRRIADDYVARMVAHDPSTAAWLGERVREDRQPGLSPEWFEAGAELARGALAALDGLPVLDWVPGPDQRTVLGAKDPVEADCARLLRERLTAELACHEAGDHLRSVRAINAPFQTLRNIFTLSPTETDADWANAAGRLRALPGALDGYRQTLRAGVGRGLLSAPRQVDAAIRQLTAWTGEDSGGPSWFTGFVADGPERRRAELDRDALTATAAIAEFRDWLRTDYAPLTVEVPDAVGRETYLRSARRATGADLDVAEAYEWAWSEFHRTLAEMRVAAEQVLPGAGVLAAMNHLNEHGHVVEGEEGIRAWLQELMERAIEDLDGTHFDIAGPLRRVETHIAPPGSSVAPHYSGPSLDFSRPGRTYLPALGRTVFPTWQLVSTWYHEGVPGHHLQLAQAVTLQHRLSRYQVTLGKISANVEGWALYAERLMDELGFLTDPAHRLGYLDKQMLRIIRVIIDIGMHLRLEIPADSPFHPGERWTPELGTAFMAAYHGSPAARRHGEIERYLGWPGQAIGYKLGERAWLRGREQARRRQGADFDLKAWHMAALSQGSLGLDDLAASLAVL
ncbi:uncharacterized protein (DUF885 family) [Kitasatospora sp. GAS204A]|uniref:DUF885 domain-containing protein n=1 Tax=unclassified Kitasatospora TaxID=2633591 RepID=UPI002474DB10|nr:DUF885 domain-containing protein [Kitasatospora sp. GAS204B]MDH6119607.1 uncharacterized protein (DUF885 family) [Kitasatospora sp. GAS204B]